MIRPWQIAIGFLLCVGLALAAMAALTSHALQLDRAEQESRLRAELEERIGGALWTMDAEVSSLLAEELARPAEEFANPVMDAVGAVRVPPLPGLPALATEPASGPPGGVTRAATPRQEDDLVLLRFRVNIDDQWSPNCEDPPGKGGKGGKAIAFAQIDGEALKAYQEIQELVNFQQLALTLPLPDDVRSRLALADVLPMQSEGVRNNAYAPQQTALNNVTGRGQFGPNVEGLAQQQVSELPQQLAAPNDGEGNYLNVNPLYNSRRSQRNASQTMARNRLIVQRLQAVQAILAVERTGEERWSNTLWIGDHLVLARLTIENDVAMILGACLDWGQLRSHLKQRVGDSLTNYRLEAIEQENEVLKHRSLATLPVRLVTPGFSDSDLETWTPIRITLGLAWLFLTMAALAIGALLIGAVRLSERRASFVAAVTHELRSPLTTFQLYTEMLLGGMVQEDDRNTYLKTLKAESERLVHLVENVLQYSRLERGKQPDSSQEVTVKDLMQRIQPRLAERLRQGEMELRVEDNTREAGFQTDPGAVEQILYNLTDNASKYARDGAQKQLDLIWRIENGRMICEIRDYGPGISAEGQKLLFRPFSKSVHEAAESAPGVGLGLALCQRLARELGGSLTYLPGDERGARFRLQLGPALG